MSSEHIYELVYWGCELSKNCANTRGPNNNTLQRNWTKNMSCMSVTLAKKTSICLPVLCHCHCCNIYRRRKHCLARTQKLIDWNHIIIKAIFCYHLAHEISRKTLTTPLSSNYNIILLHVLLDFNAIFGTWSPSLGERYQRRHLHRLSSSSRWFVSSDKPA